VTPGYFSAPAEASEAFESDWFHTGDIGAIDEDGYLIVRGRKNEMIVTPEGLKVFPEDVELVLNRVPGVRDSVAVGRERVRPSDLRGSPEDDRLRDGKIRNCPSRPPACSRADHSPEGQDYLGAMAAAANFAWCNRQIMMHLATNAFIEALGISPRDPGLTLIYDVCHNIAKFEDHVVDGVKRVLCVHRKGATRAFGPGHPELPKAYRRLGQPVLIPGDMGRYSFVLIGLEGAMRETFGSSCHGAGRLMSRAQAMRESRGRDVFAELAAIGVTVRAQSRAGVAEEMPESYKDVADVVEVLEAARVMQRVARLKPFLVIKG
jgi:RNA-splicing ligase RtcB